MIHLCIDVYMSFFGFSSHLVSYAVLISGPPWFFIKSNVYTIINPPPFPFGKHKVLCYVARPFGKVHLYPFLEFSTK